MFIILGFPRQTNSDEIQQVKAVEVFLTPVQYADKYAQQYQIDASVFKKVMWCESSNRPDAIGDNGKAVGVMQFHKETFDEQSKLLGEELDYNSTKDQIKLASWMFSKNKQSHWTCYNKVTNN